MTTQQAYEAAIKALEIQEDESRLQAQGTWAKGIADPDHPVFVKWLGPAVPGQDGYSRHMAMSRLRRQMRYDALALHESAVPISSITESLLAAIRSLEHGDDPDVVRATLEAAVSRVGGGDD
jgi:hypothetical protein